MAQNKDITAKKKKRKFSFKKFFRRLGLAVLIYFLWTVLITFAYKWINPPITILMVQRCLEQSFSSSRQVRLKKTWVDYDDISKNMVLAVIAAEDNNFPNHKGFDFKAIEHAQKVNKQRGKKAFGGSTITQQTAKNAFLWIQKSYIRKGLEAWHTVLMETFWSKRRIMEVYLNIIEFGDGIYGVEAASQYYFHHSAKTLTKREAALLTSVLPSPLKRNPAHPSSYLNRRADNIQKRMNIIGRPRI
ncbi:MAG: monofunctional biosynthetic peptidoglycan transglycosylase [Bacteroidales bacterium]|nr:monofunctional biosynthetic peptidoglycan transglycosylase [Bacteroidales bacterium]